MKKALSTIILLAAVTMTQVPVPQQQPVMTTVASNTAINTDVKQGLVDPPKWVYPNYNYWQNIGVYGRFGWVPF